MDLFRTHGCKVFGRTTNDRKGVAGCVRVNEASDSVPVLVSVLTSICFYFCFQDPCVVDVFPSLDCAVPVEYWRVAKPRK